MIVTIDGPAGAGKSSISRQLAARLGFCFLDTGAMYRAIAFSAMETKIDMNDQQALAHHASELAIEIQGDKTLLNGVDISDKIRTQEVTRSIRFVADHPQIRERLVELQRIATAHDHFVTEGRDQGTVAFPNAQCKIYLTASPEERAKRRLKELLDAGRDATFDEVFSDQKIRDFRDTTRPVGALRRAADAIEFETDDLSSEQVLEQLEEIVRKKMKNAL